MTRALKLDPDRKLAIREADVERTCVEWMAAYDYVWVPTKAEDKTRAGSGRFRAGTLDGVFVHPDMQPLWCEFKARRAATKRKHLAAQTDTAAGLRALGFVVYQAREKDPDPIGSFQEFVKGNL